MSALVSCNENICAEYTKKKLVVTTMRFNKVNLLDRGKLKDTTKKNWLPPQ